MLDFDGDGYARALGGGDCDDSDPEVHPGALDIPGDGIDADCDGQDATDALPPPATMAELPASVPPDLNLLLVTIDTLRADHLGCYGYGRPTSPAIDALAAEGALFVNGWAHAPSTRYSMPAIATGRWPSAITWDESIWWPRLGRNMRTTAEALHDDGYFTAGMFSFNYFAIADHRGFERGMDLYRSDRAVLHVAVNGPMESRGSSSREMTDDAIAFVDAHKDHKFFLWLHYYDPHLSYEPHAGGPLVRDGAHGSLRRRDPLHRSALRAPARPPARGGPLGQDGHHRHRRSRRGVRRARRDRARLRPLHGADARAVHRARAGAGAAAGGGAGRPRRHRAHAGEPGARAGRAELHRPLAGPRPRRAARPPTPTRARSSRR